MEIAITTPSWRNRVRELRYCKPSQLADHPHQWRTHPDRQRAVLEGVLREIGIAGALLAYESARLGGQLTAIDGHLRKSLGDAEWPTLILDVNDQEADLLLATHDPIGAMAGAEAAKVDGLIAECKTEEAAVAGFLLQLREQHALPAPKQGRPASDEPDVTEQRIKQLVAEWGTATGQLWEIPSATLHGVPHRLLCGDSTDREVVQRLMQGRRAVLFATDPPYLVGYDGTNHPQKWGEEEDPGKNKDWSEVYHDWDKWDEEQGPALYEGFIAAAQAHALAPDAAWYCWHATQRRPLLQAIWDKHGAFVHQEIYWVKDRGVLTRSWYMWQTEPCIFGWVRGHMPKKTGATYPTNVWQVPTTAPGTVTLHPTRKPLALFAVPIEQHTAPGDLCYEPFAGSGTQLAACEEAGRLCYALEKAPAFVAVILQRLREMGLEARLVEAS